MTQEEVVEMTLQAGWTGIYSQWISPTERQHLTVPVTIEQIEAFSNLVAAKEREACAKVCEEHPDGLNMLGGAYITCAKAIRARGERSSTATGFIGVR